MMKLYDLTFELIDEHNENWKPGDEINSLVGVLEQDRHQGKGVTQSDIVHTVQGLMMGM